jgi:hypothetical protein
MSQHRGYNVVPMMLPSFDDYSRRVSTWDFKDPKCPSNHSAI